MTDQSSCGIAPKSRRTTDRTHISSRALQICHGAVRGAPAKRKSPLRAAQDLRDANCIQRSRIVANNNGRVGSGCPATPWKKNPGGDARASDDALVLGDGDWVSLDDPSLYKPTAQIWGPEHPALGSPKSWRSALLHPTNVATKSYAKRLTSHIDMWLLWFGLDLAELLR